MLLLSPADLRVVAANQPAAELLSGSGQGLVGREISELLPDQGDGRRRSNSDPVTGQAAWFDLKVKIERVGPRDEAEPAFGAIPRAVPQGGDRP